MAISCGCKSNSNSSLHAIFFLIIILLFSTRACCDDHQDASKRSNCLESERIALLAIKSDLYNSDHWLSSWSGYDCCNWKGIACDNTTSHVIMLDVHYPYDPYASYPDDHLSYNNISGGIPLSMGNFSSLLYLDVSYNGLFGGIPDAFGKLTSLLLLDLSSNEFYGCIPYVLGNLVNLEELYISDNNISCQIPGNIGKLHNLRYFQASQNNLMGQIPMSLGDLC
ncbi:uncharacterized protein LOC141818251, partial [Curcuma longa]|uniref:uncharacterized protein LOC141818251 n=1 Tax=Curcuma longa TaxID=136217 RepID=UPI003D9F14F8